MTVRYDGSYWTIDNTRPAATNLYGTVPVANGGTGNTTVDTTPTSGSTKMVTSEGILNALQSLKDSIKIASGSYVGDGTGTLNFEVIGNYKVTYTGTTPRKITFPFNPNVVLLVEKESGEMYVIRNGEPTTKIYVTARVSKSGSSSYRLYCNPEVNFALRQRVTVSANNGWHIYTKRHQL